MLLLDKDKVTTIEGISIDLGTFMQILNTLEWKLMDVSQLIRDPYYKDPKNEEELSDLVEEEASISKANEFLRILETVIRIKLVQI